MDTDALIGRLYKALVAAEESKISLLRLIAALKSGEVQLEQLEITATGLSVKPRQEIVECTDEA